MSYSSSRIRWQTQNSRVLNLIFAILAILSTTSFVLIASGKLYATLHFVLLAPFEWHRLAAPPDQPVEILAYRYPAVIVQTLQGHIYSCAIDGSRCDGILAQAIPAPTADRCDMGGSWPAPPLPAPIIDMREFAFCGADTTVFQKLAITSDGVIWSATSFSDWLDTIGGLLFRCLSTVGMFTVSGLIAWTWMKRR